MAAITVSWLILVKDTESSVEQGMTSEQISDKFRIKHPTNKGFSSMSVRTFCRKINIGRNCKFSKIGLMKEVFQWTSDANFDIAISIFQKISPEY